MKCRACLKSIPWRAKAARTRAQNSESNDPPARFDGPIRAVFCVTDGLGRLTWTAKRSSHGACPRHGVACGKAELDFDSSHRLWLEAWDGQIEPLAEDEVQPALRPASQAPLPRKHGRAV
ncbi:hypothetical protein L1887_58278 [Cichorium endivia]|nr:hypothetical protein L1887_58278 [Cichorium endivia]